MIRSKLHKLFLCIIPLFLVSTYGLAQQKEKPSKAEDESVTESSKDAAQAEKTPIRYAVHTGLGYIRAYKALRKGNLGADALADVKVSYLSDINWKSKKIFATLRYFPFDFDPNSKINGIVQEYNGIISAYAVGGELNYLSLNKFDFYASVEAGAYQARVTELIPVSESDRPISSFGPLFIVGGEVRFKPYERFHIGPRFYLGTGSISFWSLMLSASLYF